MIAPNAAHPSRAHAAWLSADWLSLIVALALAVLVRAGILGKVPW
jgi:hypothetical protein